MDWYSVKAQGQLSPLLLSFAARWIQYGDSELSPDSQIVFPHKPINPSVAIL